MQTRFQITNAEGVRYVECWAHGEHAAVILDGNETLARMLAYNRCQTKGDQNDKPDSSNNAPLGAATLA